VSAQNNGATETKGPNQLADDTHAHQKPRRPNKKRGGRDLNRGRDQADNQKRAKSKMSTPGVGDEGAGTRPDTPYY